MLYNKIVEEKDFYFYNRWTIFISFVVDVSVFNDKRTPFLFIPMIKEHHFCLFPENTLHFCLFPENPALEEENYFKFCKLFDLNLTTGNRSRTTSRRTFIKFALGINSSYESSFK